MNAVKLIIEKVAKIDRVEIELNGLTVIAGDNDTGKSTLGKTLYAMFNGFKNMAAMVHRQKCQSLSNAVIAYAFADEKVSYSNEQIIDTYKHVISLSAVLEQLKVMNIENIIALAEEYVQEHLSIKLFSPDRRKVLLEQRLSKILEVTDEEIAQQRVGEIFNKVFQNQVNSLDKESVAKVKMQIKNQPIQAEFRNNICKNTYINFNLAHDAIYIDNPFVVDKTINDFLNTDYVISYELKKRLKIPKELDLVTNIVNNNTLNDVIAKIEEIIPGEFIQKESKLLLRRPIWKEPLNIVNLSTGEKSFAILKLLIQNNRLLEKDVLILDEPEIHLHPEWQVRYAEFLVLLQKAFDLTVLLTTHSPYFLNAIEVYSKKYNNVDKLNVYQTEVTAIGVICNEVTNNLENIYASMAKPFEMMERLENELGMVD